MIQRIQSIYFLLAGLAIFALFLFPLAHNVYINGIASTVSITGVTQDSGGQQAPVQSFTALIAGTAVVGILPLALIFLYKNRKQQINLAYGYIFVIIAYTYWQVQTVKSVVDINTFKTSNFGIGVLLSSIGIVLTLLAIKAIQRDEKLIKSADRLR